MSKPLHPMDGSRLAEAIYIIGTAVEDGPFMEFLNRVAEAEAVPSCKGCKWYRYNVLSTTDGMCYLIESTRPPISAVDMFQVQNNHFCAAWEAKA